MPIQTAGNLTGPIARRRDSELRPSFDEPHAARYDESSEHTSALCSLSAGMTDQAEPISRPWRRFLRFSMRGMILLVFVVGAGLSWIVRQAHIQRDAVAAIRKAGGSVFYNWEMYHGKAIPGGRPWAPSWIVESIGVDFFGHVTHVEFGGTSRPADTVLAEVGRLNQLQRLWLSNSSVITEAELVDLDGLTKISSVVVNSSQVTDAGLARLKGLANLSILSLEGTQVTDAGLAHLKGLTNLSTLWLGSHKVTDAGLVQLKGLTNLSDLSLYGTQVTDAGLVHLKGLTNLSVLDLRDTQVTDAGLVHLKGLTKLSILDLRGTRVTDAGLVRLKGLTNLKTLFLSATRVTDAGVNELKRALPGLKMNHY